MQSPILQLEAVQKSYDDYQALKSLSLEVLPGEIYCLLGHNGAGKTTTVNTILNFIRPDSGRVRIDGLSVTEQTTEALQKVAYIPEQVQLYAELNAIENIKYFNALSGKNHSEEQLRAYLIKSGLPEKLFKRRLRNYSKGMRQKVGIAIAMSKQARLLVLDEPTSGLDPSASYAFSESLQELAAEGVGIFMVTHDLFRVRELNARVGILKQGELKASFQAGSYSHSELESRYLAWAD